MEAIWQYIAGVSRLLPIVKKNRLSKAKTSARTVSTRFGSAEEPRSSFGVGALEEGPACMEDWSSRIALSFVTASQLAAWASENPNDDESPAHPA